MKFSKLLLIAMTPLALTACEEEGPMERMGEQLDEAAYEVEDAAGNAADDLGDAATDVANAVEDRCEEIADQNC